MNNKEYAESQGIDLMRHDLKFHLSSLVTNARIISGLTQTQIAGRMGTQQPSIARAERGEMEPSISFLIRLGEATGLRLLFPTWDSMRIKPTRPWNTDPLIPQKMCGHKTEKAHSWEYCTYITPCPKHLSSVKEIV